VETTVRDAFVGRIVDGRYRIEARIARGGMATVYRATDLRLDRIVALKIMHATLAEDPGFVARFEREARSAAKLSHPHLVSVFDQGTDGPLVYLVMEYVAGRTVRDILREHGPLLPQRALAILDPVLEALAAAHRAGIVHRDVKPENVMISQEGAVKVTDFGLARAIATSSSTTTHGVLIGTVAYLSPEQVEGGYADTRSDVYGAGILLYELLTGEVPYAGETPLSVAYQHVHGVVPLPSTTRAGIPPELDELVAIATAREPDHRYVDAEEFLGAVRDISGRLPGFRGVVTSPTRAIELETQPIARPAGSSGGNRARRPGVAAARRPPKGRRRRGPTLLALLLLLAILIGVGAYLIGRHHSVAVPTVANLSMTAASAKLGEAGLKLDTSQTQFSDSVNSGLIISTDPPAGQSTPVGTTVRAIVSKGPQDAAVPNVAGQTTSAATGAISGTSLAVGSVSQVFDDHAPAGTVVRTDPAIGTQQRLGTTINLFVSRGPQPVKMPVVVGLSRNQATAALTAAGLGAAVTLQYSDTIPTGNVISATASAGQTVNHGTAIGLVVSKGPPPVKVPNVVDLHAADAVAQLQSLGLTVVVHHGTIALDRVLSQSVPAGTIVPKFTTIILDVV
jgi:beta-lactam-binding protein with PASTA domain